MKRLSNEITSSRFWRLFYTFCIRTFQNLQSDFNVWSLFLFNFHHAVHFVLWTVKNQTCDSVKLEKCNLLLTTCVVSVCWCHRLSETLISPLCWGNCCPWWSPVEARTAQPWGRGPGRANVDLMSWSSCWSTCTPLLTRRSLQTSILRKRSWRSWRGSWLERSLWSSSESTNSAPYFRNSLVRET